MLHNELHPEYVEGCRQCKWASVGLMPSATPTRTGGAKANEINQRERRWSKDMDAYRRLRNDGEQPNQIDGAHKVEQGAETRAELESGRLLNAKQRRQYQSITEGVA